MVNIDKVNMQREVALGRVTCQFEGVIERNHVRQIKIHPGHNNYIVTVSNLLGLRAN